MKHPIRNALTVDVEDYFHVSAFSDAISRSSWDGREQRVERNTDRLLAIFAEAGVCATFFVLGWVAERCPELVRRIHKAGHEIACHGYSHQLIYRQSRDVFRDETQTSKHILENIIGESVLGYRAASYSITKESLWALDELAAAGFVYDSSIFPIRHDLYGIPAFPRWPHRLSTPDGSDLIEFPISTISILGVRVPVSGGGYFRLYPYAITRVGLKAVNWSGNPFIFYLHPWEIDPRQPRIKVSRNSKFRHYTNLDKVESRLACLLRDFNFTSAKETLISLGLV